MSKNDITGDRLVSRTNNKAFDENFDRIFKQPIEGTKWVCMKCGYHYDATLFECCPECKTVQ